MHYQYYNHHTLLLVNQKGQIRMLYTPFRVLCLNATGRLQLHTWVFVDEVHSTDTDELQYLIFDQLWSYRHFKLTVMF